MSTNLLDYLSDRYYGQMGRPKETGSFLTISRQTGCDATEVAMELIRIFRKNGRKWKMINKEILDLSAEKLHFERQKLEHDFITAKGNAMDQVIKSLSLRYYKNDKKVRDTISDIVQLEARKGNTIIIGRAGVISATGIPGGLHVRLVAPLEWRIASVMVKSKLSQTEAEEYIFETDKKRALFLERFSNKKVQDVFFDLVINRAEFSNQQIAEIILNAMNVKNLL